MKFLTILTASALFLGACASGPSAYGPAGVDSSLGFETAQIESDRFRISYTARSGQEAQDYALLRAAQVAADEGYSHFKIIYGAIDDNGPPPRISSSVGIGTGRSYGRSHSNVGLGLNIGDVGRALEGDKVTNTIEIRLLNKGSNDPDVYDAKSVIDNIRPAVFK